MNERLRDERGVALVVTLLVLLMLTASAMTLLAMSLSSSRSTAGSRDYEATLHAAESAADRIILEMVFDDDYTTGEAYLPASSSAADQRAWATSAFLAALADPSRVVQTDEAVAVGIRPTQAGVPMPTIFAVGRLQVGQREYLRVLRLDIQRGVYAPQHALLTQADLTLQGAGGGGSGSGISGSAGNAHSNGEIGANVTSVNISGTVTASGAITPVGGQSLPANYAELQPSLLVPPVSALRTYELRHDYSTYNGGTYTGSWFDLCTGGHVRPPAPAGGAPCSHPTSLNGGSGNYRGWDWFAPQQRWTLNTSTLWSGVYYVHEAEARVQGTPAGTSLTVLAQAPSGNGAAGSITVTGGVQFVPHVQGLALLADRDIDISGTPALNTSGLFLAGEQAEIGGNGTIRGAVIAADQSHVSSVVTGNLFIGSASLTYDATLSVPLPGMVTIEKWNEL